MSRTCMRGLAWLSVAAYLFANTHTSSALAALWHRPVTPAAVSENTKAKRTCCSHCQKRQAKTSTRPNQQNVAQPRIAADDADHPICPCCPGSNPCPDNCVLCAVAKIPVTLASTLDVHQVLCSEASWVEPRAVHSAAFTGELMRPPRS